MVCVCFGIVGGFVWWLVLFGFVFVVVIVGVVGCVCSGLMWFGFCVVFVVCCG